MTKFRVQHDKNNPYMTVNKDILFNNKISAEAVKLYFIAFSRPDDWKFYKIELEKHFKEGRDQLKRAIKELQESGYLIKIRTKNMEDHKNLCGGWDWVFFETPKTENEIKEMFRKDWNSVDPKFRPTEEQPLPSNEVTKKKTTNQSKTEKKGLVGGLLFQSMGFSNKFEKRLSKIIEKEGFTWEDVEKAVAYVKTKNPDDIEGYLIEAIRGSWREKQASSGNSLYDTCKNAVEGSGIRVTLYKDCIEFFKSGYEQVEISLTNTNFIGCLEEVLRYFKIKPKK